MNGALLREMAVIGAANRALDGVDVAGFWPNADAFGWVRSYRFVDEAGASVADDPHAWFAVLAAEGRRGVRVSIGPAEPIAGAPDIPERQLSGFLGGGPVWRLEAVGGGPSVYWRAVDEMFDDPMTDKPHGVCCVRLGADDALRGRVPDLAAAIRFYGDLFGAEPSTIKSDYAKWMLEDPRLNFAISKRGGKPGVHRGVRRGRARPAEDEPEPEIELGVGQQAGAEGFEALVHAATLPSSAPHASVLRPLSGPSRRLARRRRPAGRTWRGRRAPRTARAPSTRPAGRTARPGGPRG